MNRTVAAIAAAAIAAAGLSSPAFAAEQYFAARVKTSDLNLQTDKDVRIALQRVRAAAKDACTDYTVGSRIGRADAECVAKVSAELVRRINAPTVQAAFDADQSAHRQG